MTGRKQETNIQYVTKTWRGEIPTEWLRDALTKAGIDPDAPVDNRIDEGFPPRAGTDALAPPGTPYIVLGYNENSRAVYSYSADTRDEADALAPPGTPYIVLGYNENSRAVYSYSADTRDEADWHARRAVKRGRAYAEVKRRSDGKIVSRWDPEELADVERTGDGR